jgi:hypothetical protein
VETFQKTRLILWRDHLLAIALILIGIRLVSISLHVEGHEILCILIQLAASAVLIAAGALSIFMLSEPVLNIDTLGISESGYLMRSLNWSMTWNDIAYAQLTGELRSRLVLVGLDSEEPEHILSGYEHFETILTRIRQGLNRFGRKIIEETGASRTA